MLLIETVERKTRQRHDNDGVGVVVVVIVVRFDDVCLVLCCVDGIVSNFCSDREDSVETAFHKKCNGKRPRRNKFVSKFGLLCVHGKSAVTSIRRMRDNWNYSQHAGGSKILA